MSRWPTIIDETEPPGCWLYEADRAEEDYVVSFATPQDAKTAALVLRRLRRFGAGAEPGTYNRTTRDPRGEGRGWFRHIEVCVRGCDVVLRNRNTAHYRVPMPRSSTVTPRTPYRRRAEAAQGAEDAGGKGGK